MKRKTPKNLKEEFVHIQERLEKLCEAEKLTMYEKYTILNMTKKVVDNLARNYKKIREEVVNSMGGKVLDHEAKDLVNKGYKNGYDTGFDTGYDTGIKAAFLQLVKDGILELAEGAKRLDMEEQELAQYI